MTTVSGGGSVVGGIVVDDDDVAGVGVDGGPLVDAAVEGAVVVAGAVVTTAVAVGPDDVGPGDVDGGVATGIDTGTVVASPSPSDEHAVTARTAPAITTATVHPARCTTPKVLPPARADPTGRSYRSDHTGVHVGAAGSPRQ
ncbi:MAG: hypothetical protein H0U21_15575 [Acidimicrobiia bacterium]|nr:hypothetical protein [Acidimicrobiia bacterium]